MKNKILLFAMLFCAFIVPTSALAYRVDCYGGYCNYPRHKQVQRIKRQERRLMRMHRNLYRPCYRPYYRHYYPYYSMGYGYNRYYGRHGFGFGGFGGSIHISI